MKRSDFTKTLATLAFFPTMTIGDRCTEEELERSDILFVLIDPYMTDMRDLIKIRHPKLSGVPILRYRKPEWGRDHPAIEIFTADKSTGVTTIEELKKKLGVE